MVCKIIQYFNQLFDILKKVVGVGSGNYIYFRKSKGFPDENITAPTTSDYSLNPQLSYLDTKARAEFTGSCLKQDKITFNHGEIVNIYIVYEIRNNNNSNSNYPTLKNCLFGAVSLTKNADIDKYEYLDMESDLMDMDLFHILVVEMEEI